MHGLITWHNGACARRGGGGVRGGGVVGRSVWESTGALFVHCGVADWRRRCGVMAAAMPVGRAAAFGSVREKHVLSLTTSQSLKIDEDGRGPGMGYAVMITLFLKMIYIVILYSIIYFTMFLSRLLI